MSSGLTDSNDRGEVWGGAVCFMRVESDCVNVPGEFLGEPRAIRTLRTASLPVKPSRE